MKEQRGEWHFGWVLEGRAIQDVILAPPREERHRTGRLSAFMTRGLMLGE